MKRSNPTRWTIVAAIATLACDAGPMQPDRPDLPGATVHASGTAVTLSHFSVFFQATALCAPEIGRIRFSGIIEGVDHTTVDGQGETHRTRQFRVKGLGGENLDFPVFYNVIGGAEMLTWHTQLGQTPGVPGRSFHAGTLVFDPIDGGHKVVAHHAIRFVENAEGELVIDFHEWRCTTRA